MLQCKFRQVLSHWVAKLGFGEDLIIWPKEKKKTIRILYFQNAQQCKQYQSTTAWLHSKPLHWKVSKCLIKKWNANCATHMPREWKIIDDKNFFLILAEILQLECHNYRLFFSLLFGEARLSRLNLKHVSSSQRCTQSSCTDKYK